MTLYCSCHPKHKTGFASAGSMWVCASCRKPARMYLEAILKKTSESVVTDFVLFRYGPHHNELWTVAQLLYKNDALPDAGAWIADYQWTDEIVKGSESGRIARLWTHREDA